MIVMMAPWQADDDFPGVGIVILLQIRLAVQVVLTGVLFQQTDVIPGVTTSWV